MDPRITRVLAHFDAHLAAPLRLSHLAADVDLSPSRFSHLFRIEVGTSPARYLRALRLLRARLLLERTFLTVKEVMALVGCHDASHFSRDFRRFHGMSPSALRGRGANSPLLSVDAGATVERVAALANERSLPLVKPQPRARAPGHGRTRRNATQRHEDTRARHTRWGELAGRWPRSTGPPQLASDTEQLRVSVLYSSPRPPSLPWPLLLTQF